MGDNNSEDRPEKIYNDLAIASFALSITGLLFLPFIINLFIVYLFPFASGVVGYFAQIQIVKNKEMYKGQWMSITAIALSILAFFVILIFNFYRSNFFLQ